MARATIEDGKIALYARYAERSLAAQVPGSRYNHHHGRWDLPLSWGSAWALRGVFGGGVEIDEPLHEWVKTAHEKVVAPLHVLHETLGIDSANGLYPFQEVGVQFLNLADSVLLADEMGTGKTVQTIEALRRKASLPILVVAPNSVAPNWVREFEAWWPEVPVTLLAGTAAKRRKQIESFDGGVMIMNWEKLRLHSRLAPYGSVALKKCSDCDPTSSGKPASCQRCERDLNEIHWAAVVADEAHRAKTPKAQSTRALWALGRKADRRIALTGTPISNSPADLWSVMHFVAPEDWPSRGAFIDRYCLTRFTPWGSGQEIVGIDPRRETEFYAILRPRFLRRTKKAVLPQLPDKVYQTRWIELTPKQAKAYRQMANGMLADLDSGVHVTTEALTQLLRLLQLTSAFAEVDDQGQWRMAMPSAKISELLDLLEEVTGQVVVFAESEQLISLTAAAINEPVGLITGPTTLAERERAIERFQAGELRIMLATLGAGGEGLTLTAADTLVFMERSWSLVRTLQAEDRLHRIGQTADQVTIIDLIAGDTIDEHRQQVVQGKEKTLKDLVQDEETLRRLLA